MRDIFKILLGMGILIGFVVIGTSFVLITDFYKDTPYNIYVGAIILIIIIALLIIPITNKKKILKEEKDG